MIDEKSMISFDLLYMIDQRLREAFSLNADQHFGGCSILLMGDYGQLPPVVGAPLYDMQPDSNIENQYRNMGFLAFRKFNMCFTLNESKRQAGEENESFRNILDSVYNGTFKKPEWDTLRDKSYGKLTEEVKKVFDDQAIMLSARKIDMLSFNKRKLREQKQPIAQLRAVHSKPGLAQLPSDKAGGLMKDVWLCRGARVVLTENLWIEEKLVNGSVGTVIGILYWDNEKPPGLPIVLCTFKDYTGPSFLPGVPKCVPIIPKERQFFYRGAMASREMTPLLLGWGITIHKSQGMTLDNTFIRLGPKEFASGLTYTAMSRNKSIDTMCLHPFPDVCRFLNIFNSKTFKRRQFYEKTIRPPLEENFIEYSNRLLSEAENDSGSDESSVGISDEE